MEQLLCLISDLPADGRCLGLELGRGALDRILEQFYGAMDYYAEEGIPICEDFDPSCLCMIRGITCGQGSGDVMFLGFVGNPYDPTGQFIKSFLKTEDEIGDDITLVKKATLSTTPGSFWLDVVDENGDSFTSAPVDSAAFKFLTNKAA